MRHRRAGETRRWQLAIAVLAAYSVFIALIAGSALRQKFAAAALPEPAAWSQTTPDTHANLSAPQDHSSAISQPVNKTNTKPFHYTWMTKERPLTWNRLSPQSVFSPIPLSFGPLGFAGLSARSRAPTTVAGERDILTQLCVARR